MDEIAKLQEMTDRLLGEAKKSKKSKNAEKADVPDVQPRAYSYSEALDFSQPLGALNLYRSQGVVNFGPYTGVGPYIDDNPHRIKHDAHEMQSAWEVLSRNPKSGVVAEGVWGKAQALVEDYAVAHEDIDEANDSPQAGQKAVQMIKANADQIVQKLAAHPDLEKKILDLAKKAGMAEAKDPKDLGDVDFTGAAMATYPAAAYLLKTVGDVLGGGSAMHLLGGLGGAAAMMALASIAQLLHHKKQTGVEFSASGEPMEKEGAGMDEKHVGFKKLAGKLSHEKGVKDPKALAAAIGRKKYGAAGMAKKAAAGRK